ncbi:MAG TPA: sugar ABC transporter permease [Bacillota bacterium]|jgi:glucose/mannose transport system permease protein|nr:sugar ABC transporter permease [Bacillota bacterium]
MRWVLKENLFLFLLLLPAMVLVGVFIYYFIGWTVRVSMTDWQGLRPSYNFVGLRNFLRLFSDYRFVVGAKNNLFVLAVFIGSVIPIGFILALMLDQNVRFEALFRSIFLLPMALSLIVTATAWAWLYNPTLGINSIFQALGLERLQSLFIADPNRALFWVTVTAIWQFSGFAMAIYLAALRAIPEELTEAARIDGANFWQILVRITLPLVKPATVSLIVLLTHVALKIFDLVWVMTSGGPGYATDVPALYMFVTTFRQDRVAYGAAIAVVMFVFVMVIIGPYLVYNRRKEVEL